MNTILCLAGDGIGPEIMQSAMTVLESAADIFNFDYTVIEEDFGGAAIDKYGLPFTKRLRERLNSVDAILLAAIGEPKYDEATIRPEAGLLELRKELEAYANIRPLKVEDSLSYLSPLKEDVLRGTDLVIVRELTGGAYFGQPRTISETAALDSITYSYEEIERIARYAFKLAMSRKKRLCSVDKANVLATSKLWRRVVEEVSKDYPEVELSHMYVDAMAMALVSRPSSFDVIVTENLFGDILSDEASVLGGSLGLLASYSYSLSHPALYEPAHGSAPDIAGQNIANPIAMIYSLCMMLRQSFNQAAMADSIELAVRSCLESGYMTKDLNSSDYLGTREWTQKLITEIRRQNQRS